LREELESLADAGILKVAHGERALPDCPIGDPVFGPGVEQVTDPEGISGEVVALEDKRRFERIVKAQVTGADLLES
jgi:hypothetical protein